MKTPPIVSWVCEYNAASDERKLELLLLGTSHVGNDAGDLFQLFYDLTVKVRRQKCWEQSCDAWNELCKIRAGPYPTHTYPHNENYEKSTQNFTSGKLSHEDLEKLKKFRTVIDTRMRLESKNTK